MAKRNATKRPVVPAPQNLREAEECIRKIGAAKRAIQKATYEMNLRIAEVKIPFVEQVERDQAQLDQLLDGLFAYAQGHRDELTDHERRKSVPLPTGVFGWRLTPKAVVIKGVKAVMERLEALGLSRFIRTKQEPDKEAMLREEEVAASVDGVTIGRREEFYVKPSEVEVEIAVPVGKRVLTLAASSP